MTQVAIEENDKGKSSHRVSALIIAVLILAGIIGAVWLTSNKYEPVVPGSYAPDFTLKDRDGKEYTLSSLRGTVVFVNFWATWCKSCKEEMPSMEALYTYMKERNMPFEMLAISMDRVTTQKEIDPFARSLGLTFPILLDPWGKTDGQYKLTGVPETYIVDTEGQVAEKISGPRDWTMAATGRTIFRLLKINPETDAEGE